MQTMTKLVSSPGRSCIPLISASHMQLKPEKSPARNGAAGLDFCSRKKGTSAVTGEFRNVTTAETDLSEILVGQHLIGGQTVLIGPVSLVAGSQSGNKANDNHDLSLNSIICCSAI